MGLSRRTMLAGLAGGGALGAGGLWWMWGGGAGEGPAGAAFDDDLDGLVDALVASHVDDCLRIAADAHERGVPLSRLLAASFLMPIASGGDAGDIHAMAAVPPVARLVRELESGPEGIVAALWSVADSHAWSRRQRVEHAGARVADARAVLGRAFDDGDAEVADRAAAALAESDGVEETARLLRLDATRRRGDAHVVIWAAQASRFLGEVGGYGPQVLRSVARYSARRGRPMAEPVALETDESDSTTAQDVVRALRDSADTPLDGLSASTLWEAMAMLCAETRLADPSATGIGVHQTTAFDGLVHVWHSAAPEEQPAILSRAVAWMVDLHRRHGARGASILDLPEGQGDPFARAREDPVAAYRASLRSIARDRDAFLGRVRTRVAEHGNNAHDFKHWAAVLDVGERLEGPARDRWLATMAASHVFRTRDRWPRYEEALALARR